MPSPVPQLPTIMEVSTPFQNGMAKIRISNSANPDKVLASVMMEAGYFVECNSTEEAINTTTTFLRNNSLVFQRPCDAEILQDLLNLATKLAAFRDADILPSEADTLIEQARAALERHDPTAPRCY